MYSISKHKELWPALVRPMLHRVIREHNEIPGGTSRKLSELNRRYQNEIYHHHQHGPAHIAVRFLWQERLGQERLVDFGFCRKHREESADTGGLFFCVRRLDLGALWICEAWSCMKHGVCVKHATPSKRAALSRHRDATVLLN